MKDQDFPTIQSINKRNHTHRIHICVDCGFSYRNANKIDSNIHFEIMWLQFKTKKSKVIVRIASFSFLILCSFCLFCQSKYSDVISLNGRIHACIDFH